MDKIPGGKGGFLTPYKPGQSGNPKGKPKGIKNTKSIIDMFFVGDIEDSETGDMLTIHEMIVLQVCRRALAGDLKAAEWLIEKKEGKGVPIDVTPELTETQIAIAKRYAEKVVEQHKNKGE